MQRSIIIQPGDFLSIFEHHQVQIEDDYADIQAYMHAEEAQLPGMRANRDFDPRYECLIGKVDIPTGTPIGKLVL